AMAVAEIATQAKIPVVIMNAATASITRGSPYYVRVSMTIPQFTVPLAQWAYKEGIRKVYSIVSDYAPGYDAEAYFSKTFKALGGKAVPEIAPVAAWEGTGLIHQAVAALGANADGAKYVDFFKGKKLNSPRGPIMIDPEERAVVQNVYIRRVEKRDGKLVNID